MSGAVVRPEWPRRTVVVDTFPDSALRHAGRDAVVCIDVLQTSTTLLTAVEQGRRTFVAGSAEAALRARTGTEGALLAGEPEPQAESPAPGFHVTDSPMALLRHDTQRPFILYSAPGTELITLAASCKVVLIAAFRNLAATVTHVARHYRDVALLAAGCREEFSCEDQMAAAWLAQGLAAHGFEAEDLRTRDLIRRWAGIEPALAGWGNSAQRLRTVGREPDLDFVLRHVDDLAWPCVFRPAEDGWGEVSPAGDAAAREERRQVL